jgi:hypothetical protein
MPFLGFIETAAERGKREALENNDAGSTTHMKDEVIEWVLEDYPSLKNDKLINELNVILDEIKNKKADKDILHNHGEIINIPVANKEAVSENDVLTKIKDRMKLFSIPGYRAIALRGGGKRRSRRARKPKKSKRSKKANKRGTRRS